MKSFSRLTLLIASVLLLTACGTTTTTTTTTPRPTVSQSKNLPAPLPTNPGHPTVHKPTTPPKLTSDKPTEKTVTTVPQTPTVPKTVTVSMKNFKFFPVVTTISVGDTVTWTNDDTAPHNVSGSGITSPTMKSGAQFSQTFSKAGTFDYTCTIHPGMKGTVIVK